MAQCHPFIPCYHLLITLFPDPFLSGVPGYAVLASWPYRRKRAADGGRRTARVNEKVFSSTLMMCRKTLWLAGKYPFPCSLHLFTNSIGTSALTESALTWIFCTKGHRSSCATDSTICKKASAATASDPSLIPFLIWKLSFLRSAPVVYLSYATKFHYECPDLSLFSFLFWQWDITAYFVDGTPCSSSDPFHKALRCAGHNMKQLL